MARSESDFWVQTAEGQDIVVEEDEPGALAADVAELVAATHERLMQRAQGLNVRVTRGRTRPPAREPSAT